MPDELPLRLEAGTQNSAGIAGLLLGVQFVLEQCVEKIHAHEMRLASQLIEQLQAIPGLGILGPVNMEQRTAVVSVTVDNYIPDQLSAVLDKVFGVATRAGLHCAPKPIRWREHWRMEHCVSVLVISTQRKRLIMLSNPYRVSCR